MGGVGNGFMEEVPDWDLNERRATMGKGGTMQGYREDNVRPYGMERG